MASWSGRLARLRLTLGALAAALIHLGGASALAADRLIPNESGLPWGSGASVTGGNQDAFGTWRGRPLDARTIYFGFQDWRALQTSARALRTAVSQGDGRLVVALAMLPTSNALQHEECAAGQFDAQIRLLTAAMLAQGAQAAADAGAPVAIRLGWEANGNSFPWRATGDGLSWRGCFRRWVDILNPTSDEDGDDATHRCGRGGS